MPLVAAGITLSVWERRELELSATWFLTTACLVAAWRQLHWASRLRPAASWLMRVAAASLALAMTLAAVYALGMFLGTPWLTIPWMLRTHGVLQALGFTLPTLVAWHAVQLPSERFHE
jgi:hypothetical protein